MATRIAVLVAVASLQAACYNYTPLRRAQLSPSVYLAVTLTDAGSEELAPYIGPNMLVIRGRFLNTTGRGLVLSVESVESRRGDMFAWKGESVAVPGEFVRSLEERHVATAKTALLASASVISFFAAFAAFGPGSGGTMQGGVGGPPSPR